MEKKKEPEENVINFDEMHKWNTKPSNWVDAVIRDGKSSLLKESDEKNLSEKKISHLERFP